MEREMKRPNGQRWKWIGQFILIINCFNCQEVLGQITESVHFERLKIDAYTVLNIKEDGDGNLWMSSLNGLWKYNGYETKLMAHDAEDTNTPISSFVASVYPDLQKRLWIGYNGYGIDRYDLRTKVFTHFKPDAKGLKTRFAIKFFEDKRGRMWIGAFEGGLYVYNEQRDHFTQYLPDPAKPQNSLSSNSIRGITDDAEGNLWIATEDNKLNHFNLSTQTWTQYPIAPTGHSIRTMSKRGAELWLGVRGDQGGLIRFNTKTHQLEDFRSLFTEPLTQISSIAVQNDQFIWVGTSDKGLFRVDLVNRRVRHFEQNAEDTNGLSSNRITTLYIHHNILWIGTHLGGVLKLNLRQFDFKTFSWDTFKLGLSKAQMGIISGTDLSENERWVGTNRGIVQLRLQNVNGEKRYEVIRHSLKESSINALIPWKDDVIWLGTSNGLVKFNTVTDGYTLYVHKKEDSSNLHKNIMSLIRNTDDTFYLTGNENGMMKFDPVSGKFQIIKFEGGVQITSRFLYKLPNGMIWIEGTDKDRIFNPQTGSFSLPSVKNLSSQMGHFVRDNNGQFWGTSFQKGLVRIDSTFQQVEYVKGNLPKGTEINSVAVDDNGYVWLGLTKAVIARYDPKTQTCIYYRGSEGALEYYNNVFWRKKDGTLVFGGVGGFTEINPKLTVSEISPPDVLLELSDGQALKNGGYLAISSLSTNISLFVLDYANPEANRCSYLLEGFNDKWIDCGRGFTSFLLGGVYGTRTLKVRATNGAGISREIHYQLDIPLPWWQQPWVWMLGFTLLAGTMWGGFKIREVRNIRRNIELHQSLEEARQLEREELASWIHDVPLGDLVGTRFDIDELEYLIKQQEAAELLVSVKSTLVEVRMALRNVCGELQVPGLEEGLGYALQIHAEMFRRRYKGIEVVLDVDTNDQHIPLQVRKNLFFIYRTSMQNIPKHAKATLITVRYQAAEPSPYLEIEDNGVGFVPNMEFEHLRRNKQYGLLLAQSHALNIGGELEVISAPGKGAKVRISIPRYKKTWFQHFFGKQTFE
jgi:ligand-binding sensor domain-containing protein/signal transduction histidine kinase